MKNIIDESARGTLDRPITGVIHEDRIWEQWYKKENLEKELPKMSQEKFLFECIGDQPDRIIIDNRGRKSFTVAELRAYIEKFKKAFAVSGYKPGDVVATIGLTTPELYAIKYAATSLGLITCNLNVLDMGRKDDNGMNILQKRIETIEPKMLFVADYLEDKVSSVVNNKEFSDILKVSMPIDYSMPFYDVEKNILLLKDLKNKISGKAINNRLTLNQFIKLGDLCTGYDEVYYPGMPCNISFTSGTTGDNKAVLISHDANNSIAYQQELADFGYEVGTVNLAVLPPFLAFWDSDVVHTVLCLGGRNLLDLTVDPKKIMEAFKKYGVNMGIWPQSIWDEMLVDKEVVEQIKKNLRQPIIGGTRCEYNAALTFYEMTGIPLITGYGASEVDTTFSVCHPKCNKIGSAGLPLPFNNLRIFDESMKDLTYGQPGRLVIQSPALMNGYYKRPDLTEKAMYTDENGEKWYITGDYAVLDDDGCLTVLDRYSKPVIINSTQYQLLDEVEKIKVNRNIKFCKFNYTNGKLILDVELDEHLITDQQVAIESIKDTIREELIENVWPDIIVIYDKLPRTSVGKIDVTLLQKYDEEIAEQNESTDALTVVTKENEKESQKQKKR